MTEGMITIVFIEPTKFDASVRRPGDRLEVEAATAEMLVAIGVAAVAVPEPVAEPNPGANDPTPGAPKASASKKAAATKG